MEELPTPLSRVELYLAKAAGLDVTPPEPKSRLELFLAKIAGMDVEMPAPLSLKEMWLAHVAGSAPIEPLAIEGAFYIDNQKVDVRYLAVAAGVIGATLPEKPQNRKEQYWAVIASGAPIVGVLKYVTGTNITLTDVVSGIEELQFVYGDTYQQTYSGANLYNVFDSESVAASGVTVDADGWITLKRNNTGSSTAYVNYYGKTMQLQPNTDYAIVVELKSVSAYTQHSQDYLGVSGSQEPTQFVNSWNLKFGSDPIAQPGTYVSIEKTKADISSATIGLRTFLSIAAGTNQKVTFRLSVIADTSVTPETFVYQPYTGGIPAPNPDYPQDIQVVTGEQTVTISDGDTSQTYSISLVGKNLFDKNNANILVSYFDSSTTTITADSRNRTIFIPCSSNTTYTVSKLASPSPRSIGYTEVIPTNGVQVYGIANIAKGETTGAITTGANAKYLVVRLWSSSQDTSTTLEQMLESVQIELGPTATSYAPYYNYELCKLGTYQDYIYKSGDDWYVHKVCEKYIFTGNEPWQLRNTTANGVSTFSWNFADMPAYAHVDTAVNASKCSYLDNHGRVTNINQMFFSFIRFAFYNRADSPNLSSFYANTKDADLPTFKSGVTGELLYYVLATATDTKITDATLVGQLNAIDAAVLPKPVSYITVGATDPNLPAPIKISYYGESE